MVLLEDAEHLVLMRHLTKFRRMLARRNTKQQAIEIFLYAKEINLRCICEQRAIVVIHVTIYVIISCKESASTLQQLYLRTVVKAFEHVNSLLCCGLVAMYGVSSIYYLLHSSAYGSSIIQGNWATNVKINVVTVTNRNIYRHLATLK